MREQFRSHAQVIITRQISPNEHTHMGDYQLEQPCESTRTTDSKERHRIAGQCACYCPEILAALVNLSRLSAREPSGSLSRSAWPKLIRIFP